MQVGVSQKEQFVAGQQKNTRANILKLVGDHQNVLLLGHSVERLSDELRAHGCRVVTRSLPDSFVKSEAGGLYSRADVDLAEEHEGFDVVLITGMLEQVEEPLSILNTAKSYLKADGFVVATLRNATHIVTRLALLSGRFFANQISVLNGSPARFYTREDVEKLFEDAGMAIGCLEREEQELEDADLPYFEKAFSAEMLKALGHEAEATTYQFLVVAYPMSRAALGRIQHYVRELGAERDATRLELASMRQTIEQQSAQIETLASKIAQLESHDDSQGQLYYDAYDELRQRKEELEIINNNLFRRLSKGVKFRPQSGDGAADVALTKHLRYGEIISRIRSTVACTLPAETTVLVVSRGDAELLKLDGRRAWHFPQTEEGIYAGHYPADSAAAIEEVERLRRAGAEYMLFPQTSFWWLDHYTDLRTHLETNCRLVLRDEELCAIYELREYKARADFSYEMMVCAIRDLVHTILPVDATVIVASKGDNDLLNLNGRRACHLPQTKEGVYAGHHPADDAEALKELKALRTKGGNYFLLPYTQFWWLEHYAELKAYLETECKVVGDEKNLCLIYALPEPKEKKMPRAKKAQAVKKRARKAKAERS